MNGNWAPIVARLQIIEKTPIGPWRSHDLVLLKRAGRAVHQLCGFGGTMNMVKIAIVAVAGATASFSAWAQDRMAEKLCLFAAAEKLPIISGLEISAGRIKPYAKDGSKKSDSSAMIVEIDVKAIGQNATYSFVCINGKQGAILQMLGMTR